MKHLLDLKALTASQINELFSQADELASQPPASKPLAGRSAIALFFEHSTRTLTSFQLACQRLGVDITALNIAHSSTQKGETLRDTVLTLDAMGPELFIVRHQDNQIQQQMAEWTNHRASFINAGDGTNQHPTQGLLDLYTIRQHKGDFSQLKIAIIGDTKHSRVANSLLDGLRIMGAGQVQLFAPEAFIADHQQAYLADNLQATISDADVVVTLRIQRERLADQTNLDLADWAAQYGLNQERLQWAKSDAIVMHPGPMNRGVEITDEVADGPQSVILNQVSNGVLMRQALIRQLLR
jgi:aspartate carbamoyltransferase catalytic subunit